MSRSEIFPHLVVDGGKAAVEFYQKALGAEVLRVVPSDDGSGRLMHASLSVGGATLMLHDDFPEYCGGKSLTPTSLGGSPVTLHLNVPDCDAAVAKMAAAGGTVKMPPGDMFWGDRYGVVTDPFGHQWSFSHPLTAEQKAAAEQAWQEWKARPAEPAAV